MITVIAVTMSYICVARGGDGGGASAFFGNISQGIVGGFKNNTEKKINKANAAKDYSGQVTFMNNNLKLDKAFTKRYNELQPKESGGCSISISRQECPSVYSSVENTEEVTLTKKQNKKTLQEYENQMMSATSLSQLGSIYACAKTAYAECHYIGGAGGVTKTVNGTAKFVNKAAKFFGKDEPIPEGFDVRDMVETNGVALKKDVTDETCNGAVDNASGTMNEYLDKLSRCEHIEQVTLSGYTDEDIRKLEEEYTAKKENEQSLANRTLTAGAIATTGIGGMELAMGLSQQKADKDAEANMDAYLKTFRCSYGEGKQVKAGPEEIELPGGNDAEIMKLRAEYIALANDLKERKTALGMKPGIESEEILDKATMELYDDENVGITGGAYASLYRAKMLESEEDQAKIDADKKASKNRVIAGGVLVGVGVVGGMVGNSLINGKLGELIKKAKEKKEADATEAEKEEAEALTKLKQCLKDGGAKNTDNLTFTKFTPSALNLSNIDCQGSEWKSKVSDKEASDLFIDSENETAVCHKLTSSFGETIAEKLINASCKCEDGYSFDYTQEQCISQSSNSDAAANEEAEEVVAATPTPAPAPATTDKGHHKPCTAEDFAASSYTKNATEGWYYSGKCVAKTCDAAAGYELATKNGVSQGYCKKKK